MWKVTIRISYLKELQFFYSQLYHEPQKKSFGQCSILNTLHLINNVDLEEKFCKALSLTGTKVKLDDLDACHRMKKKLR